MQNYQIEGKDGKMYWVHRSIAVAAFIFKVDEDDNTSILANKRGKGTPDFQGKWNCPCGYLDFNETLKEACSREVKEECGIYIDPAEFVQVSIIDTVTENLQNVTVRYATVLNEGNVSTEISIGTTSEIDEVEEVKWIPLSEVSQYDWAFNHDKVIKKISKDW